MIGRQYKIARCLPPGVAVGPDSILGYDATVLTIDYRVEQRSTGPLVGSIFRPIEAC
jgi:hypothetical protein